MPYPDAAFHDLARVFATRNNRILEIEILPPALGPLLQDDCSIGITKKYLVQAFVTARRIFFKDSICKPESDSAAFEHGHAETAAIDPEVRTNDFSICSEIILLFDCEHLTACNWRKKRLVSLAQRHDLNPDNDGALQTLLQALDAELSLMTSFLCSPLHRHTKSPTLWQHRLWVLEKMARLCSASGRELGPQRSDFVEPRLSACEKGCIDRDRLHNFLREELAIVLRAGDLHPKNYYAFSYMRQLHGILSEYAGESSSSRQLLAEPIVGTMLDWCQAHPADISGWMFTLDILEAVENRRVQENAVSRVFRFAVDIGWEGESLWTFVDLAVKTFNLRELIRGAQPSCPHITATDVVEQAHGMSMPKRPWMVLLTAAKAYRAGQK